MDEIDGEREALVAAAEEVAVEAVMERNAATREAEVEATAENGTVAAVDEATAAATRGVVAPSAIVMKLSARVIGVARDDLPAADKECVCYKAGNIFFFFLSPTKTVISCNELFERGVCYSRETTPLCRVR